MLFFLGQDNAKPFQKFLIDFLNSKINFSDKRHLHILLIALRQQLSGIDTLKKKIGREEKILRQDNYGKYLLALFKIASANDNCDPVSDKAVFQRIYNEHAELKLKKGCYIYADDSDYILLVTLIQKYFNNRESVVRSIKYYAYHYMNREWDIAFNYLHNIFHEICKIRFKLTDNDSVKTLTTKLNKIGIEEELLINKFQERRNFNNISHPSQKGIPSIKVTEHDFFKYSIKIVPLINTIIMTEKPVVEAD